MRTQASFTVAALLKQGSERLSRARVETPALDARLILSFLTSQTLEQLLINKNQPVSLAIARRFLELIRRRAQHEPVAYLIKRKEFYGMGFAVNNHVLIPRADSETLISAALGEFDTNQKISILDLGTGSGCLILTLSRLFPRAHGTGVDISPAAIKLARKNARTCGVKDRISFVEQDWRLFDPNETFDLVISNPPYIGCLELSALSDDVKKHEPISALYGGDDGLRYYRELLPIMRRLIKPSGICILECGQGQHVEITKIAKLHSLTARKYHKDLSGIVRCLELQRL